MVVADVVNNCFTDSVSVTGCPLDSSEGILYLDTIFPQIKQELSANIDKSKDFKDILVPIKRSAYEWLKMYVFSELSKRKLFFQTDLLESNTIDFLDIEGYTSSQLKGYEGYFLSYLSEFTTIELQEVACYSAKSNQNLKLNVFNLQTGLSVLDKDFTLLEGLNNFTINEEIPTKLARKDFFFAFSSSECYLFTPINYYNSSFLYPYNGINNFSHYMGNCNVSTIDFYSVKMPIEKSLSIKSFEYTCEPSISIKIAVNSNQDLFLCKYFELLKMAYYNIVGAKLLETALGSYERNYFILTNREVMASNAENFYKEAKELIKMTINALRVDANQLVFKNKAVGDNDLTRIVGI